jgi:hypothetical protein
MTIELNVKLEIPYFRITGHKIENLLNLKLLLLLKKFNFLMGFQIKFRGQKFMWTTINYEIWLI